MPIEFTEEEDGKVLEAKVTRTLVDEDYKRFVPVFNQMLKRQRKIRVLFQMVDFHGWKPAALWDEFKFDIKHFSDVERFAMVGEQQWEEQLALFSTPFTAAEIRYFNCAQIDQARAWLRHD